MGVMRPDLVMKSVVPVIMAGIIAIYGLVVGVLISDGMEQQMSLFAGFIQLAAGLSVGLGGLASGYSILVTAAIIGLISYVIYDVELLSALWEMRVFARVVNSSAFLSA